MLDAYVLILEPPSFVFGLRQQAGQTLGDIDLLRANARTRDLGEAVQLLLDPLAHGAGRNPGASQERGGQPLGLLEQRRQ